jgi:hypothetical protein
MSGVEEHGERASRGSRRNVLSFLGVGAALALVPGAVSFAQAYGGRSTVVGGKATLPGDEVSERIGRAPPRPRFAAKVEQFEMTLPAGKEIGRVIAVSRAPNGDLYLLNYSNYGPFIPRKPEARLPFIVRLDSNGRYLGGWGEDAVPKIDGVSQWPGNPENVEVDEAGDVWVTGWGPEDNAILRFTAEGKFIRQYGRKGPVAGDDSTEGFNRPPSVYHDVKNHELFIADGYGGHRVIAIDSVTGKFTRMWGAYGKKPSDLKPDEAFGNPTHKVARAPDGLLYVCDRTRNRVQEFELVPGGVKYLREVIIAPGTGMMGSAADVTFTPDNRYMFVTDMMGGRIWTVDRKSFEVLGWASGTPEVEGDDNIGVNRIPLHRMARLPNGDLLVTRGRKGIQRLKYLGVR